MGAQPDGSLGVTVTLRWITPSARTRRLEPWRDTHAVLELDEQLAAVADH
jgi:hypothetical protein